MKSRKPKAESRGPNPEDLKRAEQSFGFRPSDLLRLSDFGFRVWLGALPVLVSQLLLGATTNAPGPEEIPPLRPPHGELPPTFWEQHGLVVVLGGLLLLGLAGAAFWFLLRPKPPAVVPPEVRAREALEPLRSQPEDGLLLSRVSQVLRHYVAATFDLPPGELTTAEFCRAMAKHAPIGAELAAALGDFLRQCDQRKFAPLTPAQPLGAVNQALALIDRAHSRRTALAAPPTPSPVAARPGNGAKT